MTEFNQVEVDTIEGKAIAIKDGESWSVSHPWGDYQFHGTKEEVLKDLMARVRDLEVKT